MSQLDLEAVNPIAAQLGKIRAVAVTTTSTRHNLAVTGTEVWADVILGRMLRMYADGNDVYYAFNSADAGTVDETNTTAANATQCACIPAGDFRDVRPPYIKGTGLCSWLIVKVAASTAAAVLRLEISSEDPVTKIS